MTAVSQILALICSKNVELWVHAGALHYRASQEALSCEEIEVLKNRSRDVVRELASLQASSVSASAPAATTQLAPITLQQEFALTHVGDMFFTSFAARLTGRLRADWLSDCLGELMQRHSALHSRVAVVSGALRQQVAQLDRSPLRIIDLRSTQRGSDEEIQRRIAASINQWLETGENAFNAFLFHVGDDEHVLLILWDHLFHDHASCEIVFEELWRLYQSSSRARPRALSHQPMQYSEYATWQRGSYAAWLTKHGEHWKHNLREATPLRLPADRGLEQETRRNEWLDISFGDELTGALHELARARGAPLPLIVLSLISLALARWCEQERFTIPMSFSGRYRAEYARMVGYLPNFPLLTMDMNDDMSFADLCKRVTQQFFAAIQHLDIGVTVGQEVPELLDGPLYQWFPSNPLPAAVVTPDPAEFNAQDTGLTVAGLDLTWRPPPSWTTQICFSLIVALWNTPTDIRGIAAYRKDLFAERSVSTLWQDVRRMAARVTRDPEARIGSLSPRVGQARTQQHESASRQQHRATE